MGCNVGFNEGSLLGAKVVGEVVGDINRCLVYVKFVLVSRVSSKQKIIYTYNERCITKIVLLR